MAIEERKCICGCDKKFYGTIRRVYFNAACEARTRRRKNKESNNDKRRQHKGWTKA